MIAINKLTSAIGLLLLMVLGAVQTRPATARGFCNIDGVGSAQLQKDVNRAGGMFFDGGSYLMAMMGAFERDETIEGIELGSKAETFFGSAGDLYNSIRMEESFDRQLAEVNPKTAASIAKLQTPGRFFWKLRALSKIQTLRQTFLHIVRTEHSK